jgi:nucleotide-binding universal stress UspA family protein
MRLLGAGPGVAPWHRSEERKLVVFPASDGSNDGPPPAPGPFRQVLVGWDASPDSVTALKAAAAVAGGARARVVAFAVLPVSPPREAPEDDEGELSAGIRHLKETFESALASIAGTPGTEIRLHTEEGRDVAGMLCAYANEHAFDLLVLGRHGDEGILRPKLGHVAHAVARTSRIPVLLVSARAPAGA